MDPYGPNFPQIEQNALIPEFPHYIPQYQSSGLLKNNFNGETTMGIQPPFRYSPISQHQKEIISKKNPLSQSNVLNNQSNHSLPSNQPSSFTNGYSNQLPNRYAPRSAFYEQQYDRNKQYSISNHGIRVDNQNFNGANGRAGRTTNASSTSSNPMPNPRHKKINHESRCINHLKDRSISSNRQGVSRYDEKNMLSSELMNYKHEKNQIQRSISELNADYNAGLISHVDYFKAYQYLQKNLYIADSIIKNIEQKI